MNVLAALLVLALLIVVHEAGHFLAATLQGIRVSGFSIGFGPALIKRQRRGVTYALRLLPLGGFVAFPDDDENSTIPPDDPDLLRNRPIPEQALVVAAGVLANLALALVVLFGQAAFVGVPAAHIDSYSYYSLRRFMPTLAAVHQRHPSRSLADSPSGIQARF